MRILKYATIILILVAVGATTYLNLYGEPRLKRDIAQWASNIESCTPFEQDISYGKGPGPMMQRVLGATDGLCRIRMDTFGPQVIDCAFAQDRAAEIADAFRDQSKYIDLFGVHTYRISTSNPDPLTVFLNSPECVV